MLKYVIFKPLGILFNISFAVGIVPQNLRVAKVIPIFKRDYVVA